MSRKSPFLSPLSLACLLAAGSALTHPPQARATNACGATFTDRYTAWERTAPTRYRTGTILTTGTRGNKETPLRLWEPQGLALGNPLTNGIGWREVTGYYASRSVICDSSDGYSGTNRAAGPAISYRENDLAIFYQADGGWAPSIKHYGETLEVAIESGEVDLPANTSDVPIGGGAVHLEGVRGLRVSLAQGATVRARATKRHAIYVDASQGGGFILMDIKGAAEARGTGGKAIFANSPSSGIINMKLHSPAQITTQGMTNAHGIHSHGTGNMNIEILGGAIRTEGAGSGNHALYATAPSSAEITILSRARISTKGLASHGVYAVIQEPKKVRNITIALPGGSITTQGAGADGVRATVEKRGSIMIETAASITASGAGSHAVRASVGSDGDVDVRLRSEASLSGASPPGASLSAEKGARLEGKTGNLSLEIAEGASIARGGVIFVNGGYATVVNGGTLTGDILFQQTIADLSGRNLIRNLAGGEITGRVVGGAGSHDFENYGIFRAKGASNFGAAGDTAADALSNWGRITLQSGARLTGLAVMQNFSGAEISGRIAFGGLGNNFRNFGVFTGSLEMGGGADLITNGGVMTLNAASDFGGGDDKLANGGLLVIDHAANGSRQMEIANLNHFTQNRGGRLRFRLDFTRPLPEVPLLHIGAAETIFAASAIEIAAQAGHVPTTGVLPLMTGAGIAEDLDISGLSSAFGTIRLAGHTLSIALAPRNTNFCGTGSLTTGNAPIHPGDARTHITCRRAIEQGIALAAEDTALRHRAGAGATAFIHHAGRGGEIHLESGSVSKKEHIAAREAIRLSSAHHDSIAITTASGTSVRNEDARSSSHAIFASGEGPIRMSLGGSSSAISPNGDAIHAITVGAMPIEVRIEGGTHQSSGAQDDEAATVNLRGGAGRISLDIAKGATVGTVMGRRAIRLSGRNPSARQRNRIANLGSVYGVLQGSEGHDAFHNQSRLESSAPAALNEGGGSDLIRSDGVFRGSFQMGGGADIVENAGMMTLNALSDFGSGRDSFSNAGTLRLEGSARIIGLESFTQEPEGVLELAFEAHPQGVVIDAASGQAEGAVDLSEVAPSIAVISLFPSAVNVENLNLPRHVTVMDDGVFTRLVIAHSMVGGLQTYDSLLQAGWHAERVLGRAIFSAACDPAFQFGDGVCGWMDLRGRFTSHRPLAEAHYDEETYGMLAGMHFARRKWRLTVATGYERSRVEARAPNESAFPSLADRFLLGAHLGTEGQRLPGAWDLDLQLRLAYAAYETGRFTEAGQALARSAPELLTVAIAMGFAKRAVLFGDWVLVGRAELGALSQTADGFAESGGSAPFVVEPIDEILAFTGAFADLRASRELRWGEIASSFYFGAHYFPTDPASDLRASVLDRSLRARGTMERAMMDLGVSLGYRSYEGVEIKLGYEAGIGLAGETSIHSAIFRLGATF